MAGETTVSTMAGFFHTQLINKLLAPYAIDAFCSMDRVRVEPCPQGTVAVAFPTPTKDSALSATITEATGLSNTAWDSTKATATVAEVGILRQSTKLSEQQNLYGREGLLAQWADDGVKMCHEKMETDVNAQWTNASTQSSNSGGNLTIALMGAAIAQHTINKSVGQLYTYLHATAGKNLRQEVLGSGAAWLTTGAGNNLLQRTNVDGFMGEFLGTAVYTNNLGASSSSDKISVMMVDGSVPGQAQNCATGMALAWDVEMTPIFYNPVLSGGMQVAFTAAYGLVEVVDFPYVKMITIG